MKKFNFISLICGLITIAMLQACVPTAFVAGAAAGGTIVYDRRSIDTMRHDLNTSRKINVHINRDKALSHNSHIVVATFNHIVLLAGQVPSPEMRLRAEEIAQGVSGVKRIYNEIKVMGTSSTLTRSSDAWLTTKIKASLLTVKGLHSSQIKVVTEDGTVYLMGLVTRKQGSLAVEAARHIDGVQRVVKLFEYVN